MSCTKIELHNTRFPFSLPQNPYMQMRYGDAWDLLGEGLSQNFFSKEILSSVGSTKFYEWLILILALVTR